VGLGLAVFDMAHHLDDGDAESLGEPVQRLTDARRGRPPASWETSCPEPCHRLRGPW
jgi:hypothetical protein